ncbi:unnamed protein product [Caretta caretta]
MKAAVFLLLALMMPARHTDAQCDIDSMVDLKVQAAVSSILSATLAKANLLCQDVSARGALVSCPAVGTSPQAAPEEWAAAPGTSAPTPPATASAPASTGRPHAAAR